MAERVEAQRGPGGSATLQGREAEGVSYEMLQDLLRSERRSNKLMPVTARFWLEVGTFLAAVTDQFRQEQAKDPFGRRVMLLTDEVKNARHAAQGLWALRERKLAMLALAASHDRKRPDGIAPEEAELYARLVETLETARRVALGALPAEPSSAPVARAAGTPAVAPGAAASPAGAPSGAAGTAGFASAPSAPPLQTAIEAPTHVTVPSDTKDAQPLVTIRALGDIPPFVGPDMQTYLLKQGDIASVPPSIANLLVRRQKAAILEM